MVNKLLDAITKQLGVTFGNSYTYYVEDVKQELRRPSFVAGLIMPLERSRNALQYDRTMPVVVHYFGVNKETIKKECYAIAEETIEALEYLPFEGGLLRGENISWQVVEDDVLQIFITYRFRTQKVVEPTMMEILEQNFR